MTKKKVNSIIVFAPLKNFILTFLKKVKSTVEVEKIDKNVIDVTLYSAVSLINDLNVFRKRPTISNYNIHFLITSNSIQNGLPVRISAHSSILAARSPWFKKAYIKFIRDKNYKHFEVYQTYANNLKIHSETSSEPSNFILNLRIENISHKNFSQFCKYSTKFV